VLTINALFRSILITATGLTERIFKEFERIDVMVFFMSKMFQERDIGYVRVLKLFLQLSRHCE